MRTLVDSRRMTFCEATRSCKVCLLVFRNYATWEKSHGPNMLCRHTHEQEDGCGTTEMYILLCETSLSRNWNVRKRCHGILSTRPSSEICPSMLFMYLVLSLNLIKLLNISCKINNCIKPIKTRVWPAPILINCKWSHSNGFKPVLLPQPPNLHR